MLAAALQQSRQKWLNEGLFERYWSKPSKRKGVDDSKNPPKDSMSKIGQCTIVIEPHNFEVILWSVKDPQPRPPNYSPQVSMQRPIIQYGPPKPYSPQITSHSSTQPNNRPTPEQSPTHPSSNPSRATNHPIQPNVTPVRSTSTPTHHPTKSTPQSNPTQTDTSNSSRRPPLKVETAPPPKASPDPVIQLLATKASTDDNLKALMRVVASGVATKGELQSFQRQIDELNAMLLSQSTAKRPLAPHFPNSVPSPVANSSTRVRSTQDTGPIQSRVVPQVPSPATSTGSISGPYQASNSQSIRSKSSLPYLKPDISAVVFEFAAGNGDRFLFPKYSILEYVYGGTQVIVSFLLVRKGSDCAYSTYDPALDYYQPVTMRMIAHHTRILEPLSRVVASKGEVHSYMNEIMDNMTRAEYVHLAMRLPRDADEVSDHGDEPGNDGDHEDRLRSIYTPSSSVGQPRRKMVRRAV